MRHTTQPIQLTYSKPQKKKKYKNKNEHQLRQIQYNEINNERRRRVRVIDGLTMDKTIHSYRMWFMFLKLGLELEKQKTVLIMKNSVRLGNGERTKEVRYPIKVDRRKYRGWDLDDVLTMGFDDWWEDHRHLFMDQISKVLKPNDQISNDPNMITLQIDKRRRLTDVINDLRNMNKEKNLFQKQSTSKYQINGRIRYLTLLNKFNCLVLKLENKLTNKEILTHKDQYIRPTDNRNFDGYTTQKENPNKINDYGEVNYGKTIFDLISGSKRSYGGKQILLSVCDGYFVMNPNNDYLS